MMSSSHFDFPQDNHHQHFLSLKHEKNNDSITRLYLHAILPSLIRTTSAL